MKTFMLSVLMLVGTLSTVVSSKAEARRLSCSYERGYECEATGYDRRDRQRYVVGDFFKSRYSAERNALRECRRDGLSDCEINYCDRVEREDRDCRDDRPNRQLVNSYDRCTANNQVTCYAEWSNGTTSTENYFCGGCKGYSSPSGDPCGWMCSFPQL